MATATNGAEAPAAKKPNKIKELWTKAGIQPFMVLLAIKGALPSTIALAAFEGDDYAAVYSTLGYLVAIISNLSLAIQPRAKFVQSLLISVLFICSGAAMALLQLQCVIAARQSPPTGTTQGSSGSGESSYDASANAVSALFLVVWVFLANMVKAARPQMMLPMIQFCIFTIVASTYGPSFPNMTVAESFVRRLLITFLTGHAIGTGVSLFIMPVTSRASVIKQMGGMTKLITACIATHGAYMETVSPARNEEPGAKEKEAQAAKTVKETLVKTGELLGKIKLEIGFARKEVAYGKFCPDHFSQIYEKFRRMMAPIMGMGAFLEMIRTLRDQRAEFEAVPDNKATIEAIRRLESEEWNEVIAISEESYHQYQKALFIGLQHIAYQLELEKRPKAKVNDKQDQDVEDEAGTLPKPGDAEFAKHLQSELDKYQHERNVVIQAWAEARNLSLPERFWRGRNDNDAPIKRQETIIMRQKLNQHQLYLILYFNFLNRSIGRAILDLAQYADSLVADGTMKKKRFINPGLRRIRKLFADAFGRSDSDETLASEVNGGSNIFLGDALEQKKKDPEHLPPANAYESVTNSLRKVPAFFQSEAAAFGFRAAVATMSIGVVGFIRPTRTFFLEQRGLWAMIMTAISMDPHAGQGIFGFIARIGGTALAMVASIVIWYMCDHNHAGIIVVFAVWMACWMLFIIRLPQYAVVGMISSITVVLIIGYELQVDILGRAVATSNGQDFYPVYLLGPYRLACVCIGLAAAFFWTYFPYPVTTHGAVRREVGSTLYILANYYSCVHTTLDARLHMGPAINDLPASHPIKMLDAAREKVFGKILLLLTRLRDHQKFTRFEPPFGGKFPSQTYQELTSSMRNVFTYLGLIVYSSGAFIEPAEGQSQAEIDEESQWLNDFRQFAAGTTVTSHEITSQLCLLSAAVRNASPLPPYLKSPTPFAVGDKMEDVDPELLGIKHFAHPCYAAFAVGEVASAFVTMEMKKITRLVRELVGEVDFSFHVISTSGADSDGGSEVSTLWEKEGWSKKAANGNDSKKGKED